MNESNQTTNSEESRENSGDTLMDFLSTLTRHRKLVSRVVALATVGAILIAIILPKWYKSSTTVFPAEKADLLGGLEGIASFAKSLSSAKALTGLGGSAELDRYTAILKSGTVLNAVITKFDLIHVYDVGSYPMEKATKELLSNTDVVVEPEGYITIAVYDKDPQRAADMANYYVELLNKTNSELQVQNARGNRIFIEERYKKNLLDLRSAEDSLRVFQKRYGVIALPQQTEASIKAAATLIGELAMKEVKVGVLRRSFSSDNPAVAGAQFEVDELRKKLGQMNSGSGFHGDEPSVFVPFSKIPDMGMEYVRRFREVEIQYKILQFVTPLYEQAKVEERRDTPSVLVLDQAGPAERKSKPKITFYALMGATISLVLSIFLIFVIELARKLRRAHPDRYGALIDAIRNDWFGLRFRLKK